MDYEQQVEAFMAQFRKDLEAMSSAEKKALAIRLCSVIDETAFDMVATHHQGGSPEQVMQAAGAALQRFETPEDRTLN